jgi:GAF domain/ANTAR domain
MSAVGERRLWILARLVGDGAAELAAGHLCTVCAEVTGLGGAGISLLAGGGVSQGSICSSDPVSARLEQLQFELGEGPCFDAHRSGRPVLEPDLAGSTTSLWLAFNAPAVRAGAGAVFGFPLRVGTSRIGALSLYREASGPLTDQQHTDALVLADVAAEAILALQAGAPPGAVAAGLDAGADFRYVVHQATGMVAAQLDVSMTQALVRLRAHSFGTDRTLDEVAEDVVARRLRFRPPGGDGAAR